MTEAQKNKIMTPKNDVIFKRLFGKKGCEDILIDFLESILNIKIKKIKLGMETQLIPDKINEKLGILDIRVNLSNDTIIDIEMQNKDYGDITKRMTFYLNQLYVGELLKGKDYHSLNKTIAIGILNFNYFNNIKDFHTVWKMRENTNLTHELNEQEIHFIELPKFLKGKINLDNKLDQWLLFINNPKGRMINMIKEKNQKIKKASEEFEYLTGDEDLQRIAFLKRKYELDYNSGIYYAKQRGLQQGIKQRNIKIVKKLLSKNMSIEFISDVTGLSSKEIKKISKKCLDMEKLNPDLLNKLIDKIEYSKGRKIKIKFKFMENQ